MAEASIQHACLMYISTALVLAALHGTVRTELLNTEPHKPLTGKKYPPGTPWPMPQSLIRNKQMYTIDPNSFKFRTNMTKCDILTKAFIRYRKILFADQRVVPDESLPVVTSMVAIVDGSVCEKYPSSESNELYGLSIKSEVALLYAKSVWAALRGLETFSQLIYTTNTTEKKYQISSVSIKDFPRFPHRGIHIDTARHFLPPVLIKRHLDAMAYNKFNVLHWHLVDDQSFPYKSVTFPRLSEQGAYTSKQVYTPETVKSIIEYARLRGIRVIPEFDTPGHTYSWGKGHPELLTPCYGDGQHPGTASFGEYGHTERQILDPTRNSTFSFLSKLFAEITNVFPDQYIHLGMDEVYMPCWHSSPDISNFMSKNGLMSHYQLWEYYAERLMSITSKLNAKHIVWQDPLDSGLKLPSDTIVQVWKNNNDAVTAAGRGHKIIQSSCWYLNYIKYGDVWREYYDCDPQNFPGSQSERELVIGGEACLWGEYIDRTNFLARAWPYSSAIAERLWSSAAVNDTNSAAFRLHDLRCLLLRRGIPAQPVLNGHCYDHEDFWWEPEDVRQPEVVFHPHSWHYLIGCYSGSGCLSWLHYLFYMILIVLVIYVVRAYRSHQLLRNIQPDKVVRVLCNGAFVLVSSVLKYIRL